MKKKTKIIVFSIIGGLVLCLGIGTAVFLSKQVFRKPKQEEKKYNIEDYLVNYDDVYNQYINEKVTKNFEQLFNEKDALTLVNYALSTKVKNQHVYSITTGTTKALIANQTIYNEYVKNNNVVYQDSISTGFVNTARCFFYENNQVKAYKGDTKDEKTATYKADTLTTYTAQEFEDLVGLSALSPTIFLLHQDAIIDSNKTLTDSLITVSLDLHPVISCLRYMKQQKYMGDLDEYPEFKEMKLTFEIDSSFNVKTITTHEVANVKKIVWVTNTSDYVETFTYDEAKEIPQIG